MKLQILQENLSKAISMASHFVSSKPQLPILGNILLRTVKTKLLVASTNLETSIAILAGAKIEEEGEISIPGRVISEVISNLRGETVNLSVEKEQLRMEAEGTISNISGMNTSDFPRVPNFLDKDSAIPIPKENLLNLLSQVIYAASIDETRPLLTGVLFIIDRNQITLVATDGFRLSKKTVALKRSGEALKVILPKGVLGELSRLTIEDEEMFFNFNKKENQVLFGADNLVLASRIIEGKFPDFEKIIPKDFVYKMVLDKEEFIRGVKLSGIFARDSGNIVKLYLGSDFVEISAESPSSGSQKTKVDARVEKKEKDNLEIAFNYRFLEEFLQSVAGEEVAVEFLGKGSPGVFTDPKDTSLLHLIMPVVIQG